MKILLTLTSLFIAAVCFGQKAHTYFLKNDGSYVDTRDSCDYIRIVSEPDSGTVLYNVKEYYPSGKIKLIGKSSKIYPTVFQGQALSYFANGKKRQLANYHNNHLSGVFYDFYPNGKIHSVRQYPKQFTEGGQDDYLITTCADSTGRILFNDGNGYYIGFDDDFKYISEEGNIRSGQRAGDWKGSNERFKIKFTEHYLNGKLMSGLAIEGSGKEYIYKQRHVETHYRDGQKALYQFIENQINILRSNLLSNLNGTVFISFTVDPDGAIKNIKVSNSASESFNRDIGVVIGASAKGWVPASAYGIPLKASYILPINFKTHGDGGVFD